MPQVRCAVPQAPFPLLFSGKGEKLFLAVNLAPHSGVKFTAFFLFPAQGEKKSLFMGCALHMHLGAITLEQEK